MTIIAHNSLCSTHAYNIYAYTWLGCHYWGTQYFKKFTYDHARCIYVMHSHERESVSTYPRRLKAEALSNAVDVVERLRDPTDQVPNAQHLCDLHTFSSVTSHEL